MPFHLPTGGQLFLHVHRLTSTLAFVVGAIRDVFTGAENPKTGARQWQWTKRRARDVATMIANPTTQIKVTKTLWKPEVRPVVDADPLMPFKYLSEYLKTGLTRQERAAILVRHYRLLRENVDEHFFQQIVEGGMELWREQLAGSSYSMFLTFPRETHHEGDLALIFRADDTNLYTVSFTLGPGSVAGIDATNVMYIARVQGKGGAFDQIRKATKDCHDIAPSSLMLSAAEGIALELKLERIIGISANTQLSAARSEPRGLVAAYDDFWTALGATKLTSDMYQMTVPLTEKSILATKRCHRSRVKRKRAFKARVREQVRLGFRKCMIAGTSAAAGTS